MASGNFRRLALLTFLACFSVGSAAQCPVGDASFEQLVVDDKQILYYYFSPDTATTSGSTMLEVQVCDGNQPIKIELDMYVTMPTHGHGMNYDPEISNIADGHFRIKGLLFHMPGEWQIKFVLTDANNRLPVLLDLQIQ